MRTDDMGPDERDLIAAAREKRRADWAGDLAAFLDLPPALAQRIVQEPTGEALAIACKAAYLGRAAFSVLAVLAAREEMLPAHALYARLDQFDAVGRAEAIDTLNLWREQGALPGQAAA
jgi:hypothetical protein